MFSSTNSSLPGAASVDSSARSYWPRTRGPHETEQEPELARRHPAIGQRHRGLGESAARRDDLVEQVGLELAHQRREGAGVGADPARAVDDAGAFDDARQRAAERGRQGRDDAGHRRRVGGFGGPQLGRGRGCPERRGSGRSRCVRPRASRPGRAARPSRHGARRSSPRHPARTRSGNRPARRGRHATTAGRCSRLVIAPGPPARPVRRPGMPTRTDGRPGRGTCRRRRSSAGGGGRPFGPVRVRLETVDPEQLRQRRRRRGRGVDDRHALADLRLDERAAAADSGCSRAAACRWSHRADAGRSIRRPRRARRSAARGRRPRRPRRSVRSAHRPRPAGPGSASRARRPRPPGSRP